MTRILRRILRRADGLVPNLLALGYALLGYAGGVILIAQRSVVLNLPGTLLLAHALVIAAYLIHECAHNTVFARNEHNARLGRALNWLTGGCYGRYEALRHKHFRHHVDKADVVAFDYRPVFARYPRSMKLIEALEWAYIPAVELVMHAAVIVLPFATARYRHLRLRVATVLAVRLSLFAALGWLAPRALLWYALAYLLFLTVLRFMDAFQHTYEIFETLEHERGPEARRFDRAYEHRNTFSNLISVRHPWLNLLTLNFPYHNAHHAKSTAPWYQLPALHEALYGDDDSQVLPFADLLRIYHRHRVARILNADSGDSGDIGVHSDEGRGFVGVDGVSFLVAL